ncbi:MAG: hypothetical protein WBW71_05035 [Bacteroidota bacterium]
MRPLFALLLPLSLISAPSPSNSEASRQVQCTIHLASAKLKPGATGEIILTFAPEEGIHINTDPPMEFEFEKNALIHFTGVTSMPKMVTTGYLDTKRPVKYSFTLDKKIHKGKYTLKGSVHYFFCSDTEGWCNRSTQPIQLTFTVAQ